MQEYNQKYLRNFWKLKEVQVQYDSLLIFKLVLGEKKNVASRKIIMALFLFNVCEMVVQSFVNCLSDISSRHFSFLKVIIFSWKTRSQIILASFDI